MEPMMWETSEFIFSIINTVIIFLFVQSFLKEARNIHMLVKIFVFTIIIAAKFLTSHFFNENAIIISTISIISAFLVGFTLFKCKVYSASIAAVFSVIAGTISELLSAFVITSFQNVPIAEVIQFNIYRLQVRTLSILFVLIFIMLVRHFRKCSMSIMATKIMLALCVMPIVSILIVHQFVIHIITSPYTPSINETISLFSIVVVNVFIFIFSENLMRQSEKSQKLILIEAQNLAYQRHIQLLTKNHKQIRTMSHDFKQQVHELYILCAKEQYDNLKLRLSDLANRHNQNLIFNTGNIMLDSILTSKVEIAEKNKINFKRKLDIKPELNYIDSAVCVLIGNALDNAIEACLRSDKKKFIGMELIATSNQFLCHIVNTIGLTPQLDRGVLKSSKGDSLYHGVGLQSMKQTCNNLGGTIHYDYNEKYFSTWIKIEIKNSDYV